MLVYQRVSMVKKWDMPGGWFFFMEIPTEKLMILGYIPPSLGTSKSHIFVGQIDGT